MSTRAVLLAVLALAPTACKKDAAANVIYNLGAQDLSLVGAQIDIGTRTVAFTALNEGTDQPSASLTFNVPSSVPAFHSRLAIALTTPCGPRSVKLTPDITAEDERAGREAGSVFMDVTPAEKLPPARVVWVDGDGVTVGNATLAQGKNVIYDPACGGDPQLAIAGAPVGALPAGDAPVFVSSKAGTCYQYSQVVYGKSPGDGGFAKVLTAGAIHPLSNPEIQYFLRTASGSSNVAHATYELVPTGCQ